MFIPSRVLPPLECACLRLVSAILMERQFYIKNFALS
jgi:hypothetical protein